MNKHLIFLNKLIEHMKSYQIKIKDKYMINKEWMDSKDLKGEEIKDKEDLMQKLKYM